MTISNMWYVYIAPEHKTDIMLDSLLHLFYKYFLFFFSKEDIEKYQEAEELYTKAMCLEQSSVEAREALRFLQYRKVCAKNSESKLIKKTQNKMKTS